MNDDEKYGRAPILEHLLPAARLLNIALRRHAFGDRIVRRRRTGRLTIGIAMIAVGLVIASMVDGRPATVGGILFFLGAVLVVDALA